MASQDVSFSAKLTGSPWIARVNSRLRDGRALQDQPDHFLLLVGLKLREHVGKGAQGLADHGLVNGLPPDHGQERPGTYAVLIYKPGYHTWSRSGVVVEPNDCGVVTTVLEAKFISLE